MESHLTFNTKLSICYVLLIKLQRSQGGREGPITIAC
uniref:Uncharacterized protein n=1 Tax=Arundo donax TaxID=35708 RepID=A0A0A9CLF1_ARUDO